MDKKPDKKSKTDLKFVTGLILNTLLSKDGVDHIKSLMQQAKDPVGVMVQIVYHSISSVKQALDKKGAEIQDNIWLAKGGVVDVIVAEVAKVVTSVSGSKIFLNPKFLTQIRTKVAQLLQAEDAHAQANLADSKAQPEGLAAPQGAPEAQQGPPMPQGPQGPPQEGMPPQGPPMMPQPPMGGNQ